MNSIIQTKIATDKHSDCILKFSTTEHENRDILKVIIVGLQFKGVNQKAEETVKDFFYINRHELFKIAQFFA